MDLELKCPLCKDYFKRPVVLPCSHTICVQCEEDSGIGGSVVCSTCKTPVKLDARGLSKFPRNYLLENIVARRQNIVGTSQQLCQICEGDDEALDKRVATKRCEQCVCSYCDECFAIFHKAGPLRSHEAKAPGASALHAVTPKCPWHKEEDMKVFCLSCRTPACYMCHVAGDHKGHEVTELLTVCEQKKQELNEKMEHLVKKASKMIEKENDLQLRAEAVQQTSAEMQSKVDKNIRPLIELIQQRQVAMTSEIKQEEKVRMDCIMEVQGKYVGTREKVEALKDFLDEAAREENAANFLLVSEYLISRASALIRQPMEAYDGLTLQKFEHNVRDEPFDELKDVLQGKIKLGAEPSKVEHVKISEEGKVTWDKDKSGDVEYVIEGNTGDGFVPIATTKDPEVFLPDFEGGEIPDLDKLTIRVVARSLNGIAGLPSDLLSWKCTVPDPVTDIRVERGALIWNKPANAAAFDHLEYEVKWVQEPKSIVLGNAQHGYMNLYEHPEVNDEPFVCFITPLGFTSPSDPVATRGKPARIESDFAFPELCMNVRLRENENTMLWEPPRNVAECPPLIYELSHGDEKIEINTCMWAFPPDVIQDIGKAKSGGGGRFGKSKKKATGYVIEIMAFYNLANGQRVTGPPIGVQLNLGKKNKLILN